MDKQAVQDAIILLDSEVPRDGAHVLFVQYGGGPDESKIVANDTGYLRLGIELLKGAFAPLEPDGPYQSVNVDLEYLISDNSSVSFDWFERREMPNDEMAEVPSRLVPMLIFAGMCSLGLLAVVGFVSVVQWLAA